MVRLQAGQRSSRFSAAGYSELGQPVKAYTLGDLRPVEILRPLGQLSPMGFCSFSLQHSLSKWLSRTPSPVVSWAFHE